jgi:hypothetical protein
MRDFFDLHALATREPFDDQRLQAAVLATFSHRQTPLPLATPVALTPAFAALRKQVSAPAGS